jgi:hypothetical protein
MSTNVYPAQTRAIDPFSSYNSNSVNALTRMVSLGENCLIGTDSLDVVWDETSSTIVNILSGICFKDDVIIDVNDNFPIDFLNFDFYLTPDGGMNEAGYYYVVLDYTYSKSNPPPKAGIRIIKPSQVTTSFTSNYLFLKAVHAELVSSVMAITGLFDVDPTYGNGRIYTKFYAGGENTLPVFNPETDEGRFIYTKDTHIVFYGQGGQWINTSNLENAMALNSHPDTYFQPIATAVNDGNIAGQSVANADNAMTLNSHPDTYFQALSSAVNIGYPCTSGLNTPGGIILDSNYMYVANTSANEVTRYNILSGVQDSLGFTCNIGMNLPKGIAIDSTYLYVLNRGTNNITRYNIISGIQDSSGFTCNLGTTTCNGITMDDTYLYVANGTSGGSGTVTRYNKATGSIDSSGFSCTSSLINPTGITSDTTYFYIVNLSGTITRYTKSNGVQASSGFLCNTGMSTPWSVTADLTYLYVSNYTNNFATRYNKITGTQDSSGFLCNTGNSGPYGNIGSMKIVNDGTHLFVSNVNNMISLYDITTGNQIITGNIGSQSVKYASNASNSNNSVLLNGNPDVYFAPINSAALTGAPTSTNPVFSDNSYRIATTAFVNSFSTVFLATQFPISLGVGGIWSVGYQEFPSGLIIQWGSMTPIYDSLTTEHAIFAISFPTACFNVQLTMSTVSGGSGYAEGPPTASDITTMGFNIHGINNETFSAGYWFAMGY